MSMHRLVSVGFLKKYLLRTVKAFFSKSRFLTTDRTDLAQISVKSVITVAIG